MHTKHQFFVFIGLVGLAMSGCSPTKNATDEIPKISAALATFKNFWETKNPALLSSVMAHDTDMVIFGPNANEIFVGWPAMRDTVQKVLPMLDQIKITVRDQRINVGPAADVAWFSQQWDWAFTFGGQPVKRPNQRLTGVLEKQDGEWKIVQYHNSVPVTQ